MKFLGHLKSFAKRFFLLKFKMSIFALRIKSIKFEIEYKQKKLDFFGKCCCLNSFEEIKILLHYLQIICTQTMSVIQYCFRVEYSCFHNCIHSLFISFILKLNCSHFLQAANLLTENKTKINNYSLLVILHNLQRSDRPVIRQDMFE